MAPWETSHGHGRAISPALGIDVLLSFVAFRGFFLVCLLFFFGDVLDASNTWVRWPLTLPSLRLCALLLSLRPWGGAKIWAG